jgi:folate-binding protein YgfZ
MGAPAPSPSPAAAEYIAARHGSAWVSLEGRRLLAVSGPTRQKFLHALLSNEVEGVPVGQGRPAALMDPHGHLLALLRVLVAADAVLLELPPGLLQTVRGLLAHYKVGSPVRFQEREDAVLAVLGPSAPAALRGAGAELPELAPESHAELTVGGVRVRVVRAGDIPGAGFALHVPPGGLDAVGAALRAAGATPIGRATLDALRVEDGCPWYGADVDQTNLLHETGLVSLYHSPHKGCYVGQEVVARLNARGGNVNKRLRGLRLSAAAEAGAPIRADGEDVGRVTTPASSPTRGHIAMGYVHRRVAEPGTTVEVAGAPATVVALPFPETALPAPPRGEGA